MIKLKSLAQKIELKLIAANMPIMHRPPPVSSDMLDDYPGEASDVEAKLRGATKAIETDLVSIKDLYRVYENQAKEAQQGTKHQLQLLFMAKKVQLLIKDATERHMDALTLMNNLKKLQFDVAQANRNSGVSITLSELQSYRILQAIVADEIHKANEAAREAFSAQPKTLDWSQFNKVPSTYKSVNPPKSLMIDENAPEIPPPGAPVQIVENRPTLPSPKPKAQFPQSDTMLSALPKSSEEVTIPSKKMK